MKRHFTTEEGLELFAPTDSEHLGAYETDDEELSSEDEVKFALESDPSISSSSDDSTESEQTEETAHSLVFHLH